MSTRKLIVAAFILIGMTVTSWFFSQRISGLIANQDITGDLGEASAGGAELATYEGETDWDLLSDNSELGQHLTEIFRGHLGDEIEKENPEWVQKTREAFAKFEALQIKEAHVEPHLGVTTPTVFYSLVKADGTKSEDETRELANHLPFAMILTFNSNRTILVKTANPETPSKELTKSFANTLVAILNREVSKTTATAGPHSNEE